jgi:hypothetical protein
MSASAASLVAPRVKFYSGRQDTFLSDGPSRWRRMTPEDSAKAHTGYDIATREPHLGVFIVPVGNGFRRIGFDVIRLDLNIRDSTRARLEQRWREQSASLPKTQLRHLLRRAHFARSFARFEVQPESVEEWKHELECVLTNSESFEPLERRSRNV